MRNLAARSVVLGIAVAATAPVYAQEPADSVAGTYRVKFEQSSTNCEHPLAYPQFGALKIDIKGSDLQIEIDRTPLMVGKAAKPGKVSAKSPKPGHTPVDGMDGVFSVAGRITTEGMLSLVMVGEYQTAGKPLCTQSWNVSGLRGGVDRADRPKK
jgi:hypothetical protein